MKSMPARSSACTMRTPILMSMYSPSGTPLAPRNSSTERRQPRGRSVPQRSRMPAMISRTRRMRFSKEPPYSSSRLLV